jgi:hypothetical protein
MTTEFPRVCADLDGNGWPWFAGRAVTGDVFWLATPELPPTWRWADESDPIGTEHLVLDEAALTELLYGSALAETAHPTREHLAEVVEARLYAYRCHVAPCQEHDEHHRLAACHAWAAELLGTGA